MGIRVDKPSKNHAPPEPALPRPPAPLGSDEIVHGFEVNTKSEFRIQTLELLPIPGRHMPLLKRALRKVARHFEAAGCRAFFQLIGDRHPIHEILLGGVRVSYHSGDLTFLRVFGLQPGPNDIVVTEYAFQHGEDVVASTVIHELAHLAGVDGEYHDSEPTRDHLRAHQADEVCTGTDDPGLTREEVEIMRRFNPRCGTCAGGDAASPGPEPETSGGSSARKLDTGPAHLSSVHQRRLAKRRQVQRRQVQRRQVQRQRRRVPGELPDNITVVGSEAYEQAVRADLAKIQGTPEGRKLMKSIADSPHDVVIKQPPSHAAGTVVTTNGSNGALHHMPHPYESPTGKYMGDWDGDSIPERTAIGKPGKGADQTIMYEPSAWPSQHHPGTPSDAALHHELVHADRGANGENMTGLIPRDPSSPGGYDEKWVRDWTDLEEQKTTRADNAYRRRRGYPLRNNYNHLP